MTKLIRVICAVALLMPVNDAAAQIPVEVFGGDKKASIDLMFFKFFKNTKGENSRFLFFSRARSTVDYRMTKTTQLPTFGFTEAISYNHEKLKGFAPVVVGQIFNSGIFPKAGIQYAHVRTELTVFSWFVTETLRRPALDYFLLVRYTPPLTARIGLFTQLESVNTFPTASDGLYSFIQRGRVGLKRAAVQFGVGADFTQTGSTMYTSTTNVGGFLRYEF